MKRGEIWWASLPQPRGSEPGYRRAVLIVQSDYFNQSTIQTVLAAAITSNLRLDAAPGNVALPRNESRLSKDSVINVSQIMAVDKSFLTDRITGVPSQRMQEVEDGLRLVLSL